MGIDPDRVCRAYSNHRQHALVAVDNTVMFTPIERNAYGTTTRLTRCHFEVIDGTTPLGKELVRQFTITWDEAVPLSKVIRDIRK